MQNKLTKLQMYFRLRRSWATLANHNSRISAKRISNENRLHSAIKGIGIRPVGVKRCDSLAGFISIKFTYAVLLDDIDQLVLKRRQIEFGINLIREVGRVEMNQDTLVLFWRLLLLQELVEKCHIITFLLAYVVAPVDAELTRSTYLRKTPPGQRRAGGVKCSRRRAISSSLTSRVRVRLGMSK